MRNKINCVYFLLKDERIVYVGLTMNISSRVSQHKSTNKIFDSYRAILVRNRNIAKMYEKRWILRFKPIYNISSKVVKEPMNISMSSRRLKRLRKLATTEQKTQSILVENALEHTYGI